MAETADIQNEKNVTELLKKQQLKNEILKICEPMCRNIMKEKPKNIAFYMINWLQNKYNYSSSLLNNDEKKDLLKLKNDLQIFYEMNEHIHFIESQNKAKKEAKAVEKKSKGVPKPKPRLPPEEIIPSDEENNNNPDEIDIRLDDPEYLNANTKFERRPSSFEYSFLKEVNFKKSNKSTEIFEFIKTNLMKSPLFSELSLNILTKCIEAMEEKSLSSMNEVVKQGNFSNYFYFILEGELEGRMGFTIISKEGNKKKVEKFDPKLVKVYYPGDYFGELNLLYSLPSRATIKTITEAKLYILDRNIYKQILNNSYKEIKEKRILLFKTIPIFETLSDEEFEKLIQIVKEVIYYSGETIVKENEYCNNLMIIEEGSCIGKKVQEMGKIPLKFKDYKEKEIFFEGALLKAVKSNETIIANSEVLKLLYIDRNSFKNIFGPLENILMRNLEIYHKYFPPLPEIPEEPKPIVQPLAFEGENINPDNIQPANNANGELEKNKEQELLENQNNGEQRILINNNINFEEYIQKINKEKEELKEEYENKLKALNDENNSLKNQLMNNNNYFSAQNNISNNIDNNQINNELNNGNNFINIQNQFTNNSNNINNINNLEINQQITNNNLDMNNQFNNKNNIENNIQLNKNFNNNMININNINNNVDENNNSNKKDINNNLYISNSNNNSQVISMNNDNINNNQLDRNFIENSNNNINNNSIVKNNISISESNKNDIKENINNNENSNILNNNIINGGKNINNDLKEEAEFPNQEDIDSNEKGNKEGNFNNNDLNENLNSGIERENNNIDDIEGAFQSEVN